jgi:hypothetical protein
VASSFLLLVRREVSKLAAETSKLAAENGGDDADPPAETAGDAEGGPW